MHIKHLKACAWHGHKVNASMWNYSPFHIHIFRTENNFPFCLMLVFSPFWLLSQERIPYSSMPCVWLEGLDTILVKNHKELCSQHWTDQEKQKELCSTIQQPEKQGLESMVTLSLYGGIHPILPHSWNWGGPSETIQLSSFSEISCSIVHS